MVFIFLDHRQQVELINVIIIVIVSIIIITIIVVK